MKHLDFSEFTESNWQDWAAYASKEIKNASIEDALHWLSYEGIVWQPYYDASFLTSVPVEAIQAAQRRQTGWQTLGSVTVVAGSEKSANQRIKQLLSAGVTGVVINFSANDAAQVDAASLLHGLKMAETPLYFNLPEHADWLKNLTSLAPYQWKGGLVGQNTTASDDFSYLSAEQVKQFKLYEVSTTDVHFAGGNVVQELAALLNDWVQWAEAWQASHTLSEKLDQLRIEIHLQPNYFLTIAQLRAARYLLTRVADTFGVAYTPFIQGTTSGFYQTAQSPNTNILRATTEAMAGAIGGCDALLILPHDAVSGESDEFSERIAKNIALLMQDEAYLDATADAAAGAYFIECLTYQLIEKSWEMFLNLQDGLSAEFMAEVEAVKAKRLADYASGKIMVGANKFQVAGDTVADAAAWPRLEKML